MGSLSRSRISMRLTLFIIFVGFLVVSLSSQIEERVENEITDINLREVRTVRHIKDNKKNVNKRSKSKKKKSTNRRKTNSKKGKRKEKQKNKRNNGSNASRKRKNGGMNRSASKKSRRKLSKNG